MPRKQSLRKALAKAVAAARAAKAFPGSSAQQKQ
jgi:hypothetical protein